MVRLMLVLAPVMCILSGIAVSSVLNTYMKNLDGVQTKEKSKKQRSDNNYPLKNEVFAAQWRLTVGHASILKLCLKALRRIEVSRSM